MLRRWWNRKRPVYVVAGFQRSGTTMMLQALEAGGLKVDRAREGERREDYELGEDAYASVTYEALAANDPSEADQLERFPREHRGHLIKVLVGGVQDVHPQPGGIVSVFMHRPWAEISASYERRHGIAPRRDWAEKAIERELTRWRGREDVTLVEFEYGMVRSEPCEAMQVLRDAGFPINVGRATRVIRPPTVRVPLPPGVPA